MRRNYRGLIFTKSISTSAFNCIHFAQKMDKNGFKIGSYQCHSKELPKQWKLKKGHNNIAKAVDDGNKISQRDSKYL